MKQELSEKQLWEGVPQPHAIEAKGVQDGEGPFRLLRIAIKPVWVQLRGFVENPFVGLRDLGVVWGDAESTYVPTRGAYHDYRLDLEKQVVEIEEPGLPPRKEERYFLTLKKPGEEAVVVERGKITRLMEHMATLEVKEGKWWLRRCGEYLTAGKKVFNVYGGDILSETDGGGVRKFKISEVKDKEVVLQGAEGKKCTLPAPGK